MKNFRLQFILYYCMSVLILPISQTLYADGSRNLYPSGAIGSRASLYSKAIANLNSEELKSWPFSNLGVHYVYAVQGEKIALASSAQGVGQVLTNLARIRIYNPAGTLVINYQTAKNGNTACIKSRTQELAGPKFPNGSGSANGFTPYFFDATQTGIWKIEFVSTTGEDGEHNLYPEDILAVDNWTQQINSPYISAWDISVCNNAGTAWISGRVFSTVLNMGMDQNFTSGRGFESEVYVLTKDGYKYKVDNNGQQGMWFTFYTNNKGFKNLTTNAPIYKSVNSSSTSDFFSHNPNAADTQSDITHKIFYTIPATDLPATATGGAGGSTWLRGTKSKPVVTTLQITGTGGSINKASNGGTISFTSTHQGTATITIKDPAASPSFPQRVINVPVVIAGNNDVAWDGKDGAGNWLPAGSWPVTVVVKANNGEVHFPYIDMEVNPKGIIIQLYDDDFANAVSDYVYWDDSDITGSAPSPSAPKKNTDPPGIQSSINGHKWGGYGSSGGTNSGYGNEKAMDTWTFVNGFESDPKVQNVLIEVVDLSSQTSCAITSISDGTIQYTVVAKNIKNTTIGTISNVTGATFIFTAHTGFTITSSTFTPNGTGVSAVNGATGNQTFTSVLNLPSGTSGTFNIIATKTVKPLTASATYTGTATFNNLPDVRNLSSGNLSSSCDETVPLVLLKYDPHCSGGGSMVVSIEGNGVVSNQTYKLFRGTFPAGVEIGTFNNNQLDVSLNITSGSQAYYVTRNNAYIASGEITIHPKKAFWKTSPENSTWQNGNNWTADDGGIGGYAVWCTDVVITKNASAYPMLTDGDQCRDIRFEDGGSVGRIQKLKYRYATISLTPERNRWLMLSAPLRYMYSADFYADLSWGRANNPMIYMRYFDVDYQSGKTNPDGVSGTSYGNFSRSFARLEEPLAPGNGFVLWVNGNGNGKSYPTEDFPDGSSFEFPRRNADNSDVEYKYHNNDGSFIGSNIVINRGLPAPLNAQWLPTTQPEKNNRFRFIFEEQSTNNMQLTIRPSTTCMIGNPLMSHLNFATLYSENLSKIQNYFRLWNSAQAKFYTFVGVGETNSVWQQLQGISTSTDENISYMLPPMQAFFVETKAGASSLSVSPNASESHITPRRVNQQPENILRLNLTQGSSASQAIISSASGANNNYDENEDIYKLFSPDDEVPEIYSIAGEKAIEINVINDNRSEKTVVPIGVRTTKTGTFNLSVKGSESFNTYDQIELIDAVENIRYDLSAINEFTFNKTSPIKLEGRFYVSFSNKSNTDIKPADSQSLLVQAFQGQITVSSPEETILSLEIFDLSGRLFYSNKQINSSYATISPATSGGLFTLKVVTTGSTTTHKIKL